MRVRKIIPFYGMGDQGRYRIKVIGIQILFELAIHYTLDQDGFSDQRLGVSISEPISGRMICQGVDEADALSELKRVARYHRNNKKNKFRCILKNRIDQLLTVENALQGERRTA